MTVQSTNPVFSTPLLESIGDIRTTFDAMQALRKARTKYGFKQFSVTSLPHDVSEDLRSITESSIISSWPTELSAGYDKLALARNSPILRELREKISPVLIDILALNKGLSGPRREAANNLFAQFELTMGVSFPIYDGSCLRYVVCFLGDREPLSDEELSALSLFSTMLIEQVSRVVSAQPSKRALLNTREIEILRWTAEGKTSGEISRITGLSEHTVNRYATIATKKLGCANRTQAVVQVMRMGLFR